MEGRVRVGWVGGLTGNFPCRDGGIVTFRARV